ncbi:propanoyl-CoA C-acyltransferase domain protein [Mycobacterium xenopi 4042]|uniref:Propanoyl-CoA C-acyltransferase domain protein n=1 Tax=Mycobacterium xenopi 4042 TaxID=1299334 RepID=X7ZW51_MYCXE|nr:propanoyl-CoA C-acyltransferase domain protein [Mycobacterium xenopi 4042]
MTPFAEHFELGIKDLVPMAYAECVAHVDKGIDKSEIQAAWFGNCPPPTASRRASWPTPLISSTSPSPASRMPAPPAMTRSATEQ